MELDTLPETATPYQRWEAGELSVRDAATTIAQELTIEIEPQERALELSSWARRPAPRLCTITSASSSRSPSTT